MSDLLATPTTAGSIMVEAAREKKASDLALLDFRALNGPVSEFFLLCSGTSSTQTKAIADEVKKQMLEKLDQRPEHIEGYARGEWILMDYGYALVHIFLPKVRSYYGIEALWGDAPCHQLPEVPAAIRAGA